MDFPRRILLAITGLTPQVVTESLYALARHKTSPFLVNELHIATTVAGLKEAEQRLVGQVESLARDYGLEPIKKTFHLLKDGDGQGLEDIRTESDSLAVCEALAGLVRELTGDATSALHVSLAGGRKTMSFYLGFALSLYGRPQDRLSHVLVSPEVETDRNFFYPAPNSAEGLVQLVEIPFLRLRHGLPDEFLAGQADFASTIRAAQRRFGPPQLTFFLKESRVIVGEENLRMPPIQLAFLSMMARRTANSRMAIACPGPEHPDEELARDFLSEYYLIKGPMGEITPTQERLLKGMDKNAFMEWKSEVNNRLKKALGANAARYQIQAQGRRPQTRYCLDLPGSALEWR